MEMKEGIKCQDCGKELPEEDVLITEGKILCEDCYMDAGQRIRVCDPWGERSKMIFRESHGLAGTEGLTEQQKEIYKYIQSKGKATKMELIKQFKLLPTELENQFAILRHCQLLKGKKEGNQIYIVLW